MNKEQKQRDSTEPINVLYTLLVAVADYLAQNSNLSTKTFLYFLCDGVIYLILQYQILY